VRSAQLRRHDGLWIGSAQIHRERHGVHLDRRQLRCRRCDSTRRCVVNSCVDCRKLHRRCGRSVERHADLWWHHAACGSVGVNSNDSAGVKVVEYVDAVQAGTAICAYPLDATPKPAPTKSLATAITGSGTCPAPTGGAAGTLLTGLGAVTAGAGFGAQGAPGGTVVTAGLPTATTYTAGGLVLYNPAVAPPAGWNFMGQDVSMNVSPAAPSGANTQVITIALIPS
jgi:hypothetical protein